MLVICRFIAASALWREAVGVRYAGEYLSQFAANSCHRYFSSARPSAVGTALVLLGTDFPTRPTPSGGARGSSSAPGP
jgi:hypothetical protein